MALTMQQFDRIPTIGALLGTQGHKEVLDQINNELGSASFFGSNDDPFASQHKFFIESVVQPIIIVGQQFRQQYKEIQDPNVNQYKSIVSLKDLEEGIPECMWVAIAQHPVIKEFGKQNRVDLFGLDVKQLPDENVYDRLIHNGEALLTPEELKKNGDTYTYTIEQWSTDPDLSDMELEHLEDTYNFIDLFYKDLDKIYNSLGEHLLKEKSYIHDGVQIRDLDFTSFPDKKG